MSRIIRLDHVQLAMPKDAEADAEAFYSGLLGIPRVAKPAALAGRGGAWFEDGLGLRVHLGVEPDFRPATKAYPAFVVQGLDEMLDRPESPAARVTTPMAAARSTWTTRSGTAWS